MPPFLSQPQPSGCGRRRRRRRRVRKKFAQVGSDVDVVVEREIVCLFLPLLYLLRTFFSFALFSFPLSLFVCFSFPPLFFSNLFEVAPGEFVLILIPKVD